MQKYKASGFSEELQEKNLYILAEFFKVLGNPVRIQILLLLMEHETCVSELADKLGYTQSAVSHQLSLLKSNKLIKQRREGKMMVYTLTDKNVKTVIGQWTEHILKR